MDIRLLTNTDLSALLDLFRDLLPDEHPASVAEAQPVWDEIEGNPGFGYFGAFEGDELVAACTLAVIPNLTRQCRPYGLIENVVTRQDKRRLGIGKSLLQYVLAYAWSENCYKVMLMTGRLDAGTFAFYESAGFDRHSKQAFVAKPKT